VQGGGWEQAIGAHDQRLHAVPWRALEGLAAPLCDALDPVLFSRPADGPARPGRDRFLPAERALDRLLRQHRHLSADQRQALAESLFGVALWRRRLCCTLGLRGLGERAENWAGREVEPRALLCALLCDLGGLGPDEGRRLTGYGGPLPGGEAQTLGERWSFPVWLEALLAAELGGEAEDFAESVSVPGPIFLRANRLATDRSLLAARLREEGIATEPCRHAPDGLRVVSPRANLWGAASRAEGLFEVQDEGSQLLGGLVGARPGERVLDLCAGAGGKSLLLAAGVGRAGRVVASDVDADRLRRLARRAGAAGASCVEIVWPDRSVETPEPIAGGFAAALVDAPCSELGALRRGPDARWRIDRSDLERLPALQLALLERAAGVLGPGGRLIYATCTLRRAENEAVAAAFGAQHPELAARPACPAWLDPTFADGAWFRALPHRHGTDGFFAACWDRR
jgi:16S rRNA (cytosine967-C5)-methyltransferase